MTLNLSHRYIKVKEGNRADRIIMTGGIGMDHLVETGHCIETEVELEMRKITDRIIEIDHKTTIEMTIGEEIIGRLKITNRNIDVDIEIRVETHRNIGIGMIIEMITKTYKDTSPEMYIGIAIKIKALIKMQDLNLGKNNRSIEKCFSDLPRWEAFSHSRSPSS